MPKVSPILSLLAVVLCLATTASAVPDPLHQGELALVKVAGGFHRPVTLVASPDSTGRLFVVEQFGRIRIIEDGKVLAKPFLDLSHRLPQGSFIATQFETGLLGLAFHPEFASNGRLFVYYTDAHLTITLSELAVEPNDPNRVMPHSERVLIRSPHPTYTNHFGGQLQFGPDGYLYVGIADGGGVGDPLGHAQNKSVIQGKILRLDVTVPGRKYGIPSDNPFVGVRGVRPEIYALGLRNPWRFQFDPLTGRLFASDVAQFGPEEVNIIEAAGNYGWNFREGDTCFNRKQPLQPLSPTSCVRPEDYREPIYYYTRPQPITFGTTAIIGGGVYRGSLIPSLMGEYVFADFTHGFIHSLRELHGGGWKSRSLFENLPFAISAFGTDVNGELYLCSYGDKGVVYKLSEAETGTSP